MPALKSQALRKFGIFVYGGIISVMKITRFRYFLIVCVFFFILISIGNSLTAESIDPFGAPPKGVSPNCGPEERYKYEVRINSKEDFVQFIKVHEISRWVNLDNYRVTPDVDIDWGKVLGAVTTEKISGRIIYVLEFIPRLCGQKFTLKMTEVGDISLYGCCGE